MYIGMYLHAPESLRSNPLPAQNFGKENWGILEIYSEGTNNSKKNDIVTYFLPCHLLELLIYLLWALDQYTSILYQ